VDSSRQDADSTAGGDEPATPTSADGEPRGGTETSLLDVHGPLRVLGSDAELGAGAHPEHAGGTTALPVVSRAAAADVLEHATPERSRPWSAASTGDSVAPANSFEPSRGIASAPTAFEAASKAYPVAAVERQVGLLTRSAPVRTLTDALLPGAGPHPTPTSEPSAATQAVTHDEAPSVQRLVGTTAAGTTPQRPTAPEPDAPQLVLDTLPAAVSDVYQEPVQRHEVTASRQATSAAPGPAPAPAPPAASPAPAPGAAPASGSSPEQLEELARRLVAPLSRRLKAEMLIDRERRGHRTDAR
jgi:hypothetical protein